MARNKRYVRREIIMKQISTEKEIIPRFDFEYSEPGDRERIQKILADNDIEASLIECDFLWNRISDSYCAQWLCIPEDDEQIMEYYLFPILKELADA
jgi:hypothetical protein